MVPSYAKTPPKPVRTPVKRAQAESYVLTSLVCFGATVVITRVYLEWAGYPQIGNDVLHIAHALWGGLLLFIAALVPLILVNRWVFSLSAVLSGVGVGLFIDEVGKFITQQNDYFYAPAAPIIYSAFLLVLLLFVTVRRHRSPTPRANLYRVLLALQEALDNNLDSRERERLLSELAHASTASVPHVAYLAKVLTDYLRTAPLELVAYQPNMVARTSAWLRVAGTRMGRPWHRRLIIVLTALSGIGALVVTGLLVGVWLSPQIAEVVHASLVEMAATLAVQSVPWLTVRLVMQVVVGLLYLGASVLLWRGHEEAALTAALFASLLAVTVVNLLDFYLNQFRALSDFIWQAAVFVLLVGYQAFYLTPRADPHDKESV